MTQAMADHQTLVHTNLEHILSLVGAIRELHTQSCTYTDVTFTKYFIEHTITPLMDIVEDLARNAQAQIENSEAF